MRKTMIGVMGHGETATPTDLQNAYQVENRIAKQGNKRSQLLGQY